MALIPIISNQITQSPLTR
uniref:Uncharacterized protein n=1 Tax=Arundo donax TaxID=35708 RepID=A0A0A8YSK5_ARUDO